MSSSLSPASASAPARPLWHRLFELFEAALGRIDEARIQGRHRELPALYAPLWDGLRTQGIDMEALRPEYERRLRAHPANAEALNFYAALALLQGNCGDAAALYRQSLVAAPRQPDALYNLGCVAQMLRRTDDAIQAFNDLLKIAPHYGQAYIRLANCLYYKGEVATAGRVAQAALAKKPDFSSALKILISCHMAQGEREAMAALCRRALALHPGDGDFFHYLAEAATLAPDGPEARDAAQRLRDAATPEESRASFAFGLAKVLDAAGDADGAFAYMDEANARIAARSPYDAARVEAGFRALREAFAAPPRPLEAPDAGVTPIFILGMPRSGTSLIERILAAHSAVSTAGELDYLSYAAHVEMAALVGAAHPQGVPALLASREAQGRLREAYLSRLRSHAPRARFITDKMPGNFLFIGLIRLLLPEAKILRCVRDPVATCFAIYRQQFAGRHNYASSLASLGHCYRHYAGVMRHWHAAYPGAILDVRYEELVGDFLPQARRLVEWCGLPWEEGCAEFHRARQGVRTASAMQVTRPLYASSVEGWKRYEKHLGLLLQALCAEEVVSEGASHW